MRAASIDVEAYLDEVEPKHPGIAVSRIRANILIGRRMPHLLGLVMRIGWIPDFGGHPFPIVWDEDVADLLVAGDQAARAWRLQRGRGGDAAVGGACGADRHDGGADVAHHAVDPHGTL